MGTARGSALDKTAVEAILGAGKQSESDGTGKAWRHAEQADFARG